MKNKPLILVAGAVLALGAAGAGATALMKFGADDAVENVGLIGSLAKNGSTDSENAARSGENVGAEGIQQTSRGPVIPENLHGSADFIRSKWAEGPNLSGNYVQIAVPCGRDCFNLIIGDTVSGDIYESGMGFGSMPNLEVSSSIDRDLLLLMYENPRGGNCQRSIYRWNGQDLGAVSEILEYKYTDAGCGQFQLEHVLGDLD